MAAGSRLLYADRDDPRDGEDAPKPTAQPKRLGKRLRDMTLDEYNEAFGKSPQPKATR